jgi:recombination protein RecA
MPKTDTRTAGADEARAAAFDSFVKTMGRTRPGDVIRLSDTNGLLDIEAVPTGAMSLDLALGCGGLPMGRITEIYGPEMGGKTSLALSVAGNVQRTRPGAIGFIDAEQALNLQHVEDMGVDLDRIALYQPSSGEDAIDMIETMMKSGGFEMIIVDSIAAMVPKAEIEGTIFDSGPMASHAKLMSEFMRRIAGLTNEHNVMLVLINQLRERPGGYGNPEYVTGGRAIKFYASVRLEVRSSAGKKITKGTTVIGQKTGVKVTKNKVGPPHRTAEYDLFFGKGIDTLGSMLDVGLALGVIDKTGNTYAVASTGERIAVNKEPAKAALRENSELAALVEKEIYQEMSKPREGIRLPVEINDDAPEDDE